MMVFYTLHQKTALTTLILCGFFWVTPGGAQNQTEGLGQALVGSAQDKIATDSGVAVDLMNAPVASAPVAAPAAPRAPTLDGSDTTAKSAEGTPSKSAAPALPMELLDGIQLPDQPSTDSVLSKVESDVEIELKRLEESQGKMPSILFTEIESEKLDAAIHVYETGNFEKKVDPVEAASPDAPVDPLLNVEIVDRDLVLGGISYGDGKNWVIWLNKQRLTPARLPVEVKYINVQKSHVDVKWLDKLTGKLIPVRLRPNQRFNLDSSMFLPGTSG